MPQKNNNVQMDVWFVIILSMTDLQRPFSWTTGEDRATNILGMGSANKRRRYYITPYLTGRAHTPVMLDRAWASDYISYEYMELTIDILLISKHKHKHY